jgi:hypothetical protein
MLIESALVRISLRVVDQQTGRGVPLVELRSVDQTRYWTDSQGLVAFREPELMNQTVFFYVASHGYEFPPDGFGFRGKALTPTPGGEAELRLRRINVAERLYRVTGLGIYRDSVALKRDVPIRHPLLNAQVAGSDSVNTVVYRGKIHWFWGDTTRRRVAIARRRRARSASRRRPGILHARRRFRGQHLRNAR